MERDELGMTDGEWQILLRAQRERGCPLPHDDASVWRMIWTFAVVGAFQCLEGKPRRRGPKLDNKWSKSKEDSKGAERKRKERAKKNQAPSGLWKLVWPNFSDADRKRVLKMRKEQGQN
jgi:hypothetical protein